MSQLFRNWRLASGGAIAVAGSFCLAFGFSILRANAGDDLQVELRVAPAPPAAAAAPASESGRKPAAPSLDEEFAEFEERLQTEPAPQVIRNAVQTLRERPRDVRKEHLALVHDWLKDALAAEPDSLILRMLLAELLDLENRFDDLVKLYRELLKDKKLVDIQRAIVNNNLAYVLSARGDEKELPEAEAAIDEAIQALGPTTDLLDTRAMVRLAKGDVKAARADVNTAVKDRPSGALYFHLALVEDKAGDREATRDAMKRAVELKVDRDHIPSAERKAFDRLKGELDEKKESSPLKE
ncbi:MAG TPA: hypothetical protein VGJ26_14835 [Pirellulales bacterium]